MDEGLIFTEIPAVSLASNLFICQIPIRYKDEAMLEFVKEVTTLTPQIPIFHPDGTKLAVAKASQLYLTDAGKTAGLSLRHPGNMTVCELDGKTLFEIERQGAAALKMSAELYTNDGFFLKWSEKNLDGYISAQGNTLKVGNNFFTNCSFQTVVGIQIGEAETRLQTAIALPINKG